MPARTIATTVPEYIRSFPPATRKLLTRLRQCIRATVPRAEEGISYGIAGYRYQGILIYFAGFANHVSIYPAPRQAPVFKKELASYKGGKGTVQFPLDQPLPLDLVKRIVEYRLKENETRAMAKQKNSKKASKK